MSRSRRGSVWVARAVCHGAVLLVALSALQTACSGEGNSGRTPIGDDLAAQVPWVNGRLPLRDEAGQLVMPELPTFPPIGRGLQDPGSAPPDCSALEGLQFSEAWIETFESVEPDNPLAVGAAPAWASYDDWSEGSFRTPGDANWYAGTVGRTGAPWGLPAERFDGAPKCRGERNEWVLHFRGGRFNRFGAGLNHPLALLDPCPENSDLCPPQPQPGDTVDSAGIPLEPEPGKSYALPLNHYWDVSSYDGISFWARRGPEGQGSMVVILFDKHTSDDLNRENHTYCRRLRPCRSRCFNRAPCTPVADTMGAVHRCFDESQGPLPAGLDPALLDLVYPRCGPSACTSPTTFPDPDFDDKACQPYTFDMHESAEFCFDPGDPPPPSVDERCGDGFAKAVQLTTDWKFYKVPFSELRQQGFAKQAPTMDLRSISNLAFTFSQGWVDVYLDDVSFYREVN